MTSTVSKIVAESIGCLVWWDFEAIAVKPADAVAALQAHGMTEVAVPALVAETMIRKSAGEFRPEGFGRKEFWKAEVVGSYDDGSVEVGLLQWKRLSNDRAADKKVEWTQEDSVVYDTRGNGWLYSGKTKVAAQFIAHADQRMAYLGNDFVRAEIVDKPLRKAGAFPLRQRLGGFYFCPAPVVAKAEQIRDVIASLQGAEAEIHIAHIQATDSSAQAVGQSAREHLGSQISGLMDKIKEWRSAVRTPRSDALANMVEEFAVLKEHADLYVDALGLKIEDIQKEIESATAEVRTMIGLSSMGVPPVIVATLHAIVASHGDEQPIPLSAFVGTALPEEAATTKWWRSDRAVNAAKEAGYTVSADKEGVKFTPIGEKAEPVPAAPQDLPGLDEISAANGTGELSPPLSATPEPAAEPEPGSDLFGSSDWAQDADPVVAEERKSGPRAELEDMTVDQLRRKLERLGQKPPRGARKPELIEALADAIGA